MLQNKLNSIFAFKNVCEKFLHNCFINAGAGGTKRNAEEIKSKWRAIKGEVIKIRDAAKKTGGT